ncbi:MAG: M20/M25/M40 family metallo-hydrolase [Rhodothermales bacterium]
MEQRLHELLRGLVACNSVNPTLAGGPGECEIAAHIAGQLEGLGLRPEIQDVATGRANVVAVVRGRGEAPPFLLNAHIDTVGVEDMAAPFTLRREGDRLYGRGAYDMKGSAAVMLALAEYAAATPPPGDLLLTFVGDEEDRSLGTEYLVQHWLPTLPHPPAAAIVLEPTEEQIGVAHKGFAWMEIEVAGRAAHGSRPDQGIDAALPLGAALIELAALSRELLEKPADPLLGHGSLHVGQLSGGSAWSVYPAHARLGWERRTLPDEPEATISRELDRVLQAATPGDHHTRGRIVFTRLPHRVPVESLPVRLLQRAHPAAEITGVAFWADSALLGEHMPTALFGPIGHGAHAVDEWVSLSSLELVYRTMVDVIENVGIPTPASTTMNIRST